MVNFIFFRTNPLLWFPLHFLSFKTIQGGLDAIAKHIVPAGDPRETSRR